MTPFTGIDINIISGLMVAISIHTFLYSIIYMYICIYIVGSGGGPFLRVVQQDSEMVPLGSVQRSEQGQTQSGHQKLMRTLEPKLWNPEPTPVVYL